MDSKGPLLIACNHPDSFLDAIVLDVLFDEPIWSLARGDAFRNRFFRTVFRKLRILPVYRTSEGVENLSGNYDTFNACIELFRKNGVVLIFSEGLCENEWQLRPLKKGTARLALQAWEQGIPLTVLPVGLNYSSFRRTGKNLFIHFGEPFDASVTAGLNSDGLRNKQFNQHLQEQLLDLVYDIPFEDDPQIREKLTRPVSPVLKGLLALPAAAGYVLNLPFYATVEALVKKRFGKTVHFDSIMMAGLLFTYPFYLLFLTLLAYLFTGSAYSLGIILLLPALGWCYQWIKPQLDKTSTVLYRNGIVTRHKKTGSGAGV